MSWIVDKFAEYAPTAEIVLAALSWTVFECYSFFVLTNLVVLFNLKNR